MNRLDCPSICSSSYFKASMNLNILVKETEIVIIFPIRDYLIFDIFARTDWSVQATVSWILSEFFGGENVSIIAEEDIKSLSRTDSAGLLATVVNTVNECLAEASKYGLRSPLKALEATQILEVISRCNSTGGPTGRHWVLDPVDGTLGFVRGDQYAVALALIEDGKVVIGVLGCPNYPAKKEWLNYHYQHHQTMSNLSQPALNIWERGCVMYAMKGSGEAWMQPLIHGENKLEWPNSATLVRVSSIDDPAQATSCEPVERANSNHSYTEGLAHSVGLRYVCLLFLFSS